MNRLCTAEEPHTAHVQGPHRARLACFWEVHVIRNSFLWLVDVPFHLIVILFVQMLTHFYKRF